MNEKINFKYVITVLITVVFLSVLFVLVNNGTINTKALDDNLDKVTENITMPTTTTEVVKKESIIVNEVTHEFVVDTFNSYLGFTINYDKENLSYDVLSDSSVVFKDINNKNNYFKIIKLSENDYATKYQLSKNNELHENEIENNIYSYSFYRIGSNYFEIVESLDSNDEFGEYLKVLFKYMISTLNEH